MPKGRSRTETVIRGDMEDIRLVLDDAMSAAVGRGHSPLLFGLAALNYSVCLLQIQAGTDVTLEQVRALAEFLRLNEIDTAGRC